MLVKGIGRVGAALSPSSIEDSFFGAPEVELPEDIVSRKQTQSKYSSQKLVLAFAFKLYDKRSDTSHIITDLGLMGRIIKLQKTLYLALEFRVF